MHPSMSGKAALLPLVVIALLAGCGREPEPPARHLLYIVVDTLRADFLGRYGYPADVSPALDRLAAEGVRCSRAYSTASSTVPAMMSQMTAKYPTEHGVLSNENRPVPERETLLAEKLKERGFDTAAFVANRLLAAKSGIGQGLDLHRDYEVFLHDEGRQTRRPDNNAERRMTGDAVDWLREHFRKDRRAFLWVHYIQPHAPYLPPLRYRKQFTDPSYAGPFDGTRPALDRAYVDKQPLAREDLEQVRGLYAASVRFVDDLVSRLLKALDEVGAREDTLVVFVADHGEELYDHNQYFYHANSVYASTLHIPLILRLPGHLEEGAVHDGVVSAVDIRPTVMSLLGIEEQAHYSGIDQSAAIVSGRAAREMAFSQYQDQIFTVHTAQWAYVSNPNNARPDRPPAEGVYAVAERELYDLKADPSEQRNLAKESAELVGLLEQKIRSWQASLVRPDQPVPSELSAEDLELLQQLGYLAGEEEPGAGDKGK